MSVRAFFSSPRRRRRAIKVGVVLLAALGLGLLIAFQRNTVHVDKAANRFSNTPATVYPDLKQVRLPRSEYYKARDGLEIEL